MTDRTYWAATTDPKQLASRLRQRIDRFRDACDVTGRRALWARATRMFYGLDPEGGFRSSHYVNLEGAQGQFLGSRLNMFRSFVKSMLTMIVGSRPPHNCVPIAYDANTTEVVTIGNAYLDKVLDDGVENVTGQSAIKYLTLGEGWLLTTWDDAAGDIVAGQPVTDADGQPMMDGDQPMARPICEGDTRVISLRPDEVIRDPDDKTDPTEHRWLCASVQRNRWELMAQYPLYEKQIHEAKDDSRDWLYKGNSTTRSNVNGDMVTTYELYHRKTLAVPDGLFALMVGDTIVSMSALQYDKLPFDVMISEREPESCFGYCPSWDLMVPQSSVDSVWMQMSGNRENFGTPNLWLPKGSDIEPYSVSGGRLITGTQPPIVVDMSTGGVASGEQFMGMAIEAMQRITGLSDASIGDVSSGTSGVALAQQQQTSIAYNAPNAMAYVRMMQGMLRKLLRIAQKFIRDERMIHIAGKNRAPMVKRFKGEDFKSLEGVSIEIGSATMRDSGSRHVIAQELLQAGMLENPKAVETYLEIIASGRTEPALNGPLVRETQAERLMLQVQEGQPYEPAATMPHMMLIGRLADLIADPSMDPAKAQTAMQLIQKHDELWMELSMNPMGMGILFATDQVPHPAAQMMQQAAMSAPPEGEAPPEDGSAPPEAAAPQDAPQASPSGAQSDVAPQPSLPEGATPIN